MDNAIYTLCHVKRPVIYTRRDRGEPQMEKLTKRIDGLERTTRLLQQDVAVLTAQAEHIATKADIADLRTEQGLLHLELIGEIGQLERRVDNKFVQMERKFEARFENIDRKFDNIDRKFDNIDMRFDRLNDRLTWSIMVPAILAVLAWFVKVAVLKI
ncbi:hypothetical protein [Pantoea wallisii]|nr:hypothetical protein [Pantoea wallisii]